MRFKNLLAIILACMCLTTIVYAGDNTGQPVGEGDQSSSLSESIGNDPDSSNVVDSYDSMLSNLGDPSKNDTAQRTSATLAPIVSNVLGFFMVFIVLAVLLYTGLELSCIFVKPLRAICGAEGNGSGGGDMGGNGKKVNFLQVSEDCIAVINGGGGDMGGNGKKGVGDMAIEYLKLRMKTIIICFVVLAIFLTPFGQAIILKIVQLIFNIIAKVAGFI